MYFFRPSDDALSTSSSTPDSEMGHSGARAGSQLGGGPHAVDESIPEEPVPGTPGDGHQQATRKK